MQDEIDGASVPGVRALSSLRPADALELGEEAGDLARLAAADLPMARGALVRLGADDAEGHLRATLERMLGEAGCVRLRPLLPTRAATERFERRAGALRDVASAVEIELALSMLFESLGDQDVRASLGGSFSGVHVRLVLCDRRPGGRATSADSVRGDPDVISVFDFDAAAAPHRIDRRSGRIVQDGEGLEPVLAEQVADLTDRVQLVIGRAVEVEWCVDRGRVAIVGVRPMVLGTTFAHGTWRRVALVAADEGTVSPLAIDTLDRALRSGPSAGTEAVVRRIYSRPYRRMDTVPRRLGVGDVVSAAWAANRATRVAADVAIPLAAGRSFDRTLPSKLARLDRVSLGRLGDADIVEAFADRQRLVCEALVLLDRGREATVAVLAAVEATVGPLPRECYPALAAPERGKERRRVYERLERLARRIEIDKGRIVGREELSGDLARRWDETRRALDGVAPLGIDVRVRPIGATDETLLVALTRLELHDPDLIERSRKSAVRRLQATARSRAMGRSREAIAAGLLALLGGVAASKGRAADALAAAHLRFHDATVEVGRRLVETAVLEHPEDAFYMTRTELEEGLRGEPGAYAARVRLRREDDLRWAYFDAPRWVGR